MTAIFPMNHFHGLTNQFAQKMGNKEVNFRNESGDRKTVSSIEIRDANKDLTTFSVDPEDNVAMALSMLGIGRVTYEVEREAQNRAKMIRDQNYGHSEDTVLEQAVVNLRAMLIAREMQAQSSVKELDEAYALYTLAYSETNITREEFPEQSMHSFWIQNLRKIRQDPTALGSL